MMDKTEILTTYFECSIFKDEVRVDFFSDALKSDWMSTTAVYETVDRLYEIYVSPIKALFIIWSASTNWSAEYMWLFRVVRCHQVAFKVRDFLSYYDFAWVWMI